MPFLGFVLWPEVSDGWRHVARSGEVVRDQARFCLFGVEVQAVATAARSKCGAQISFQTTSVLVTSFGSSSENCENAYFSF